MLTPSQTRRRGPQEAQPPSPVERPLMDGVPVALFRAGLDGRFVAANAAFARLLGYAREDEVLALDPARDVCAVPEDGAGFFAGLASAGGAAEMETVWTRHDGSTFAARVHATVVCDDAGRPVAVEGAAEDVSARRAMEDEARQTRKLDELGQLAGGLAHDMNNLLTTILASAEMLEDVVLPGTESADDLEAIRASARHGADLTRKLLAYARRQHLDPRPLDLNLAAREFLSSVHRVVGTAVETVGRFHPHPVTARLDRAALDQILLNLATNARDAMPRGGVLAVQTGRLSLDAAFCEANGWGTPGRYVVVSLADSGAGMTDETQSHLFEPFFTTKHIGEGSGLGLPMVYGLMQQHDGHIRVESAPGTGTVVRLLFPEMVTADPSDGRHSPAAGHGEVVLVADADGGLRAAARDVLESAGYAVRVAADGAEALAACADGASPPVAVVVAGIALPSLGGPDLVAELRRRGTAARVVFSSGGSAREVAAARRILPSVALLARPWTATDLLGAVRAALDAPTG